LTNSIYITPYSFVYILRVLIGIVFILEPIVICGSFFRVLNITLVLILTSSIFMSNSLFLRIDDKEMNSLRIAWLSNINPFASYHLKALLCKPTLRAKETSSVAALIELKVKLESDNSRTIARVGIDPDLAFRSNGGLELLDIGTV